MKSTLQIYKNEVHQIEMRLDGKHNTVWLTQARMIDLFKRDQSIISCHVRNVFKEEESNMQKIHIVNLATAGNVVINNTSLAALTLLIAELDTLDTAGATHASQKCMN